jgi:FkbM family methyltransferase
VKFAKNTWLPDGDDFFPVALDAQGRFDYGSLVTALKHVRKLDVAVDGGAHVGTWTREMERQFAEVYAFEPQPENFECLVRNTEGMPSVRCYPFGLGSESRAVALGTGRNSGCFHVAEGGSAIHAMVHRLPPLRALDLLKLDIEGYEYFALKGAEEQILRFKPVIVIEEKDLPHASKWPKARPLLESWGYREAETMLRDVIFTPETW